MIGLRNVKKTIDTFCLLDIKLLFLITKKIRNKLCRNTGEFMMSRYREVAEIVLRYLEHRDRLVRLSITSLLPRIAHFLRDRFVTNYLEVAIPSPCFYISSDESMNFIENLKCVWIEPFPIGYGFD